MNLIRLLVCGLFLASLSARADEKLTALEVGDQSYRDVTVTMVTATDVYFYYAGGLRNVKLEDLSPNLQKRFHYNAARARNAEHAQTLASAKYYESVATAPTGLSQLLDNTSGLNLLSKIPGSLVPPKLYLDLFLFVGGAFLFTNIFSYFSGRRSARAKQYLVRRMEFLATIDLPKAPVPRQIASPAGNIPTGVRA